MNPTINNKKRKIRRFLKIKKHPVKLTALYCLREALIHERYEECAQAIAIAHEFGAHPIEVRYLLEDPYRYPT